MKRLCFAIAVTNLMPTVLSTGESTVQVTSLLEVGAVEHSDETAKYIYDTLYVPQPTHQVFMEQWNNLYDCSSVQTVNTIVLVCPNSGLLVNDPSRSKEED
jgi:hypothetical protein